MAQRVEPRNSGIRATDIPGNRRYESPHGSPSVPAALEKIASATQRVVSKRIDLFLLENHELISGLLLKAGFIIFGVVVGVAAWFTAISALVLYVLPSASQALHLVVFAAINAVVGAIVVALSLREAPKLTSEIETGHEAGEHEEQEPDRGETGPPAQQPRGTVH